MINSLPGHYELLATVFAVRESRGNGQLRGRGVRVCNRTQGQQLGNCKRAQLDLCEGLKQGQVNTAEQVEQYLAKGASLEGKVKLGVFDGYLPLHFAALFGNQPALTAMLAKKPDDINAENASGFTALDMACEAGLLARIFHNCPESRARPHGCRS